MRRAGLASSNSEARRLVTQGGVKIDGQQIRDVGKELAPGADVVVQVGKRRFVHVS